MSMIDPDFPPEIPPEIPYPFLPREEPPQRTSPVMVPLVDMPSSDPARSLLDRRTIMVSGGLDHQKSTDLCAELMALDGRSGDDITVILNSSGGPLGELMAILDVFDLMRAPVDVTCVGAATGTAAVLLACATGERWAGRHARISLRVDRDSPGPGTADEVARLASERAEMLHRIADRLASVTAQPPGALLDELESGASRDADAARSFGLVDGVIDRD
jgi:ATP-dependent Clp protease, protease subunit